MGNLGLVVIWTMTYTMYGACNFRCCVTLMDYSNEMCFLDENHLFRRLDAHAYIFMYELAVHGLISSASLYARFTSGLMSSWGECVCLFEV